MAKIKTKGTALNQEIASVLTAVAQLVSITLPECESETTECDTLDNTDAGIPYMPTGRSEGGSASADLFYDPALAGHQALLSIITTPAITGWSITFADTATSTWTFDGAGLSFGGTAAQGEGLKGSVSIKLDGLPTFPS